MELPTTIALSRLTAQQRALEVTANNLANANTSGFRAERVLFTDWLSTQTNTTPIAGGRQIAFTQDRATWREQRDGNLSHTANPLDLAIAGEGYFTVQTQAGPRLTRAGRFATSPNGTIVDMQGDALLDRAGQPIQLANGETQVTVAGDGTVSGAGGRIGRIGVVMPGDPLRLTGEGGDRLRADAATTPVAAPAIVQGAIEESNVQPIVETTRMIDLSRQFQMVAQFVQAESDRQQNAIDKILPKS